MIRCPSFAKKCGLSASAISTRRKAMRQLIIQIELNQACASRLLVAEFGTSSSSTNQAEVSVNSNTCMDSNSKVSNSNRGLFRLLTGEERDLWAEQRSLSRRARKVASTIGNVKLRDLAAHDILHEVLTQVPDSTEQGDRELVSANNAKSEEYPTTFSIVVAGEFNSGKSTVINALLGSNLLEMGALPTTDSVTILVAAATDTEKNDDGNIINSNHVVERGRGGTVLYRIPDVPLLEDLTLVDTPGTNAIVDNHTERTMKLLPTADLILFVTSADRPFPESERTLLRSIEAYRKNIVLVVNKMDVLETSGGNYGEQQKKQVLDFVTENASELLGASPNVIPLSARDALSAKQLSTVSQQQQQTSDENTVARVDTLSSSRLWQRSNFGALETFLKDTLTTETKIKSKLANPVGVAQGIMKECLRVLQKQEKELETDVAILNLLQGQLNGWKTEMEEDTSNFRDQIKELMTMEAKRVQVLRDRMGFWDQYTWTLLDADKFASEWTNHTRRAAADNTVDTVIFSTNSKVFKAELLELVHETADGLARRARAQGQAVIEYLGKRPAIKNQSLVGSVTVASRFEDTRKHLAEEMSASVGHVLNDADDELRKQATLLSSFRRTIVMSGTIHSCAIGTACATASEALEIIPGVSASAVFFLLGGYIVSYRNSATEEEYRKIWMDQSKRLDQSLNAHCSKEVGKVQRRILDGIAPYTRYVDTENERVERLNKQCNDISAEAHTLKRRISKLRPQG